MPALKDIEQPVAIAMWYVSWLWRRYPGGGFEDWDRALDELEERGYNAVRIDAFPHLVARDRDGRSVDVFHVPAYLSEYPWPIWRNQQPIDINHREALVEFVSKCRDRGIYVALSSWMHDAEPGRCEQVEGVAGLVGIWDETLTLLADNDCLGRSSLSTCSTNTRFGTGWNGCARSCARSARSGARSLIHRAATVRSRRRSTGHSSATYSAS